MGPVIFKHLRSSALTAAVVFAAACVLATPVAFAGGSGGVHVNPGSPSGVEYAIPLDNAAPPSHRQAATGTYLPVVVRPAVKHRHRKHHKRSHRAAHHKARAAALPASRRPPGTPSAGSLLASGDSSIWLMLALAGGVGVIGAGAGIAARRAATA